MKLQEVSQVNANKNISCYFQGQKTINLPFYQIKITSQLGQYYTKIRMLKVKKIFIFCLIIYCISSQHVIYQLSDDHSTPLGYTPPRKTNDKYNGIFGFILGPILFVMSFAGIWFNEKRAAINYRRLKLAQRLLQQQYSGHEQQLQGLNQNFISTNPKRLVYKKGTSQIIQAAKDEQCQVFPMDAIAIQRKVQVKQMRSHSKRRSDNEEEVQYRLEWVSENIEQCVAESNSPLRWFVSNKAFYAPKVVVAGYFLTQEQMKMLDCETQINPSPETINALTYLAQNTGNPSQPIVFNNYVYFPAVNGDVQSRGTLRVKFFYCKSTQLSIMSTVDEVSHNYEPFRIDLVDNNGQEDQLACADAQCCICCQKLAQSLKPLSQINLILKGSYSYHQMVSITVKKNALETNLLRLVFFILMVIGICAFFSPFVEVLGYLPIVGGFLKGTASIIVFLAAFIVSLPMFFITFGLAWLRYHPAIGGGVTLAAVAVIVALSLIQK